MAYANRTNWKSLPNTIMAYGLCGQPPMAHGPNIITTLTQKLYAVTIVMAKDSIKHMEHCKWSRISSYDYNTMTI